MKYSSTLYHIYCQSMSRRLFILSFLLVLDISTKHLNVIYRICIKNDSTYELGEIIVELYCEVLRLLNFLSSLKTFFVSWKGHNLKWIYLEFSNRDRKKRFVDTNLIITMYISFYNLQKCWPCSKQSDSLVYRVFICLLQIINWYHRSFCICINKH